MKAKKWSIYSVIKYVSYELLLEEQIQSKTDNSRLFERLKKKNVLKLKFLTYKIINSFFFAIQPVFVLIAYLNLNLIIPEWVNPQIDIFIRAMNFHFFFIFQLFNFFLLGLFNLTSVMSGENYDLVKILPFSRKNLKKLVLFSIYHNLNLPIITNTIAFPVIMLIATQNFNVFMISLGLSVMNMIFSLTIMIILCEKIVKFMKKHGGKSRKPLFIQLLNSFSYVLIIFGGIFVIEVILNLVFPFLLSLPNLNFSHLANLILFLIPFPFNASYIIVIFTSIPQMHIAFWINLSCGFGFYLIILYFLIRKSSKSIDTVLSLKYIDKEKHKNKENEIDRLDDKFSLKILVTSQFKAFIRKDLLIASRDLPTSMYFILPIINSFTFMFFFNLSLFSEVESSSVDVFFNNWLLILLISPILSSIIVYTILNIDKNGKTIIDTLPIIRRDQARSKLFLIILLQIIAVLTPPLIFLFHSRFIDLFLASMSALPFVIAISITTFLLRIQFFGKKEHYYTLDELLPEKKIGIWGLILVTNYLICTFPIIISNALFYSFNFLLFLMNILILSLIISIYLYGYFNTLFPKDVRRNWSLFLTVTLIYCYLFVHLLILNSIILIPIAYISLTGLILFVKYGKIQEHVLNMLFKKSILKPGEKKVNEKTNWMGYLLLLAILFFAYSLIPIFLTSIPLIYISIGIFLIIAGLSLIIKIILSVDEKQEKKIRETKDLFQIDFLKAAMIFLVIFDHTIPWAIKNEIGVALWERISIPVFLVIMGFNFGRSSITRGKDNFGTKYLYRKLSRYLLPFAIIYIISIFLGFFFYETENVQIWLLRQGAPFEFIHLFIGILPFWGPGNWFIPIIFGSIIILPIIFKGFSGKTIWASFSLILCFLIEMGMQYVVYSQFKPITYHNMSTVYMFLCNILYYTSAIGLGMWISRNHKLFSWHNIINWILFPLSLTYIIFYQFFDFRFTDSSGIAYLTGDYNYLVTPYSAFLVLLVLKLIPKTKKGGITRAISVIGKSSYHILLTQIIYFAILVAIYGDHYRTSILGVSTDDLYCFINLCINWAICIPIGVIWWSTENSVRIYSRHKRMSRKN